MKAKFGIIMLMNKDFVMMLNSGETGLILLRDGHSL